MTRKRSGQNIQMTTDLSSTDNIKLGGIQSSYIRVGPVTARERSSLGSSAIKRFVPVGSMN